MKKAILIVLFLLLGAQGCSFLTKKVPDATISEKVVELDPEVLKPCRELKNLSFDNISSPEEQFNHLLYIHTVNAATYAECAKKQDASILLLKKFSNKETK